MSQGPHTEKGEGNRKGETRWETKVRRIRTKVRNKRQTNKTKNKE